MTIKSRKLAIGLLASTILIACSSENDTPYTADDTMTLNADSFSKTVGYLKIGETLCTGFLTDFYEITTAYHCLEVSPGETYDPQYITFLLEDGSEYKVSNIAALLPRKDMARLQLETPAQQFLKFSTPKLETGILVAFDQDEQKIINQKCKIEKFYETPGVFAYKCDTKGHYSGSPIIQEGKVVGMHVGYKPKIDRKVAINFGQVDNENTDVLEIEYLKEGCHIRSHIRGDIFEGHSRAHARGCTLGDIFINWWLLKKEKNKLIYDEINENLELIKEDNTTQMRLLQRSKVAWEQFNSCAEDAKKTQDREKARNCISSFRSEMNIIASEIKISLESINRLGFDNLTEEVRAHVHQTHKISQDLVKLWETYTQCNLDAIKSQDTADKVIKLRGCHQFLKLEFDRITVEIESLDVDIWDILIR